MTSLPLALSRAPVAVILRSLLAESFVSVFRVQAAALLKDLSKTLPVVKEATTYTAMVEAAMLAFVESCSLFFVDLCAGRVPDTFVSGSKADLAAFHAILFEYLSPLRVFSAVCVCPTGFVATNKCAAALKTVAAGTGPAFVSSFFAEVASLFADAFAVFLEAASFADLCNELVFTIQTSLRTPSVFGHSLASGLVSVLAFRDLVAYSKLIRPDELASNPDKVISKDAALLPGLVACLRFGALPSPVVAALELGFDQAVLSVTLETAEATLAANRTKQWSTLAALLVGSRQRCIEVWTRLLTSIAPVLARLPKVAQLTTALPGAAQPSAAPAVLCHRCGAVGHSVSVCSVPTAVYLPKYPCGKCKGMHWNVDCPKRL